MRRKSHVRFRAGENPEITSKDYLSLLFAVDVWAKSQGIKVNDPENIRFISGAILRAEAVGISSTFLVTGRLPENVSAEARARTGIYIGYDVEAKPYEHTLHLIPRTVHLGVGCKRGTGEGKIERAVRFSLERAGIPLEALKAAATIDVKRDEPGLLMFCDRHKLKLRVFTAEELGRAEGEYTASEFVKSEVGVDNVCERSAVLSSKNGKLILRKTVLDGVTAALAEERWEVRF